MRHNNKITFKMKRFYSDDSRTTRKIKPSRRAKKILPGHLIFPSCLPYDRDDEEKKRLKKFRMKIELIIWFIEGYLNNLAKEHKIKSKVHIGTASTQQILYNLCDTDNLSDADKKRLVENWFGILVQLRVFALKEYETFQDQGDNQNVSVDEIIEKAKRNLKKLFSGINKWNHSASKTIQKLCNAVLKEENLILDFRKTDHDLTNASDIIKSLRNLLENYKKHEEFDQLKKDIKDELRKFGRQAYQHDVREARLYGKDRGNRPPEEKASEKIKSNYNHGNNYQTRSNNDRNQNYNHGNRNQTMNNSNRSRYTNHGNKYQTRSNNNYKNNPNRTNNTKRSDACYDSKSCRRIFSRRYNDDEGPSMGPNRLEGKKRKYFFPECINEKKRMELIESKIAKYEKKIKLIQSKIENFM